MHVSLSEAPRVLAENVKTTRVYTHVLNRASDCPSWFSWFSRGSEAAYNGAYGSTRFVPFWPFKVTVPSVVLCSLSKRSAFFVLPSAGAPPVRRSPTGCFNYC